MTNSLTGKMLALSPSEDTPNNAKDHPVPPSGSAAVFPSVYTLANLPAQTGYAFVSSMCVRGVGAHQSQPKDQGGQTFRHLMVSWGVV